MEEIKHLSTSVLPEIKTWDQPYFPTYEKDTLLCTLSDSESYLTVQEQNGSITIISRLSKPAHCEAKQYFEPVATT